jgi:hypothetical protein
MFFSIGIPYYKEGRVDEVKIIKSSDFKSLSNHPQIETHSRTLSDLTRESLKHSQRVPTGQCLVQPDNLYPPPPWDFVRILNLDPTARFLRESYINTSTSNGYLLLAFRFFLLKEFILCILRASTHLSLELSFQVLL